MGRPPLRKDGRPLTGAEKQRRYRAAVALREKQAGMAEKRARRAAALALRGMDEPGADVWWEGDPRRFVVLYVDPPWRFSAVVARDRPHARR